METEGGLGGAHTRGKGDQVAGLLLSSILSPLSSSGSIIANV